MSIKDILLNSWRSMFGSPSRPHLTLESFPVFTPGNPNFMIPRDGVEVDFFLHWVNFCRSRFVNENFALLTIAPGFIDRIEFLLEGNASGAHTAEINAEFQRFKDVFVQTASTYQLNLSHGLRTAIDSATTSQAQLDAIRAAHSEIIGLTVINTDLLRNYIGRDESGQSQFDRDLRTFERNPGEFHREAAHYFQDLVQDTRFDPIGPGRSGRSDAVTTDSRTSPPAEVLGDHSRGGTEVGSDTKKAGSETKGSSEDSSKSNSDENHEDEDHEDESIESRDHIKPRE